MSARGRGRLAGRPRPSPAAAVAAAAAVVVVAVTPGALEEGRGVDEHDAVAAVHRFDLGRQVGVERRRRVGELVPAEGEDGLVDDHDEQVGTGDRRAVGCGDLHVERRRRRRARAGRRPGSP